MGSGQGLRAVPQRPGLSQEQIELITKWVDGGIRRGNNPSMLPKTPDFRHRRAVRRFKRSLRVSGRFTRRARMILDGLLPERVPADQSMQVVARLPGGHVEPLVWLHGYDAAIRIPSSSGGRSPPGGTVIQGVPSDAAHRADLPALMNPMSV